MKNSYTLKVGLAQIAPVWLYKLKNIEKIKSAVIDAAAQQCELVVFGEGLLPGYSFWLSLTNGAEFNSKVQKEIHAQYLRNAIQIELGELNEICTLANKNKNSNLSTHY